MARVSIGTPAVHGAAKNGWEPAVDITPNLPTVVIRLLSMALRAIDCPAGPTEQERTLMPSDYRKWPFVETEASHLHGGEVTLRYYVCPKGAATPDDQLFPAGTCLVVETYDLSRSVGQLTGMPEKKGNGLRSVFTMEKYASLNSYGATAGQREAWAYATYGPDGTVLATDSTACGVCQLPFMYV